MFYNFGVSDFILPIIVLVILILVIKSFFKKNDVSLALTKLSITQGNETQIVIEGRETGFIPWILSLFNLNVKYSINVTKTFIAFSSDGYIFTPMQKISSTTSGARNPIGWLIVAGIFVIMSIICFSTDGVGTGLLVLVLAVICVVLYNFKKSFYISIQTVGGHHYGFSFKRTFTESVTVDFNKVREVVDIINNLVLDVQ